MDQLDSIMLEYTSAITNYRDSLVKQIDSTIVSFEIKKSTFNSTSDYLKFRKESLSELISEVTRISSELHKYNKFKTLNKKIIKQAIHNNLVQGKFYDYAVGFYNYREVEPKLFELIDKHFRLFSDLSKQLEELTKELRKE